MGQADDLASVKHRPRIGTGGVPFDVGPAFDPVLDHGELGYRQPVVDVRVGEVHQAHRVAAEGPVLCMELRFSASGG
jgi:hypothetical protein